MLEACGIVWLLMMWNDYRESYDVLVDSYDSLNAEFHELFNHASEIAVENQRMKENLQR